MGPEGWSALANWVMASAAAAAAIAAFRGLNTWKAQTLWKGNSQLSRELLYQLFLHRDAIKGVRYSGIVMGSDADVLTDEEMEKPEAYKEFRRLAHVYEERWRRVTSVRAELYPKLIEAEVIWGTELGKLVQPIFDLESELFVVVSSHLRSNNPNIQEGLRNAAGRSARKKEKILYDGLSEDDNFETRYEDALKPTEKYLRQMFGKKSDEQQ
jgi:hypothetical protein